ncbi:hypothetical protein QYE76_046675 [Lolium multiflorum]|uniref:Fe2OG dioxygenase domain-containing protein n=1 Tax=Lolium multiflorum TaxID=4521 RepID=A0AAD8TQ89_LOLMU|nr:hypothetical protein QYE76_046675 [Lolium multiflorum]
MAASNSSTIPTVDLAPFFVDDKKDGVARARATEVVREACQSSGFFRVVNHGVPRELMARALELQALFFALPDEEKAKVRPAEGTTSPPFPAGHARQPTHSVDKNELLLVLHPKLWLNLYPAEPAGFREALVECHSKLTELALLIQELLNECMGLPAGFLREYNDDRTFDFMSARHSFPATKEENTGTRPHQDISCISFVVQDSVGGLEVLGPDGDWAPVEPVEGSIVVNIGDVVQVLSNGKFRSVMHRVVRNPAAHRYSLVFFLNVHRDKWVEPLPQLAAGVGEAPRYSGFKYGDYLQLRAKYTKAYQLLKPVDLVDITHYAI